MKKILLLLLCFQLTSCVTNYYYVTLEEDTAIYEKTDNVGEAIIVIPKGSGAYVSSGKKKYKKIKWQNYKGWAINPTYSSNDYPSYKNKSKSSSTNYNSSTRSSSGGTVNVKGYTRKDGTYVRPHTRSAPRRK